MCRCDLQRISCKLKRVNIEETKFLNLSHPLQTNLPINDELKAKAFLGMLHMNF